MKPSMGNREQAEFPFARGVPFGAPTVDGVLFGREGQRPAPQNTASQHEDTPQFPFSRELTFEGSSVTQSQYPPRKEPKFYHGFPEITLEETPRTHGPGGVLIGVEALGHPSGAPGPQRGCPS